MTVKEGKMDTKYLRERAEYMQGSGYAFESETIFKLLDRIEELENRLVCPECFGKSVSGHFVPCSLIPS